MIRVIVVNPRGILFDHSVERILAETSQGQMVILAKHIPIVASIPEGFLKTTNLGIENYFAISGGILENNNDVVTVISQEAAEGKSLEEAKENLQMIRKQQKDENQRKLMDFTEMEKELANNLKMIKASQV